MGVHSSLIAYKDTESQITFTVKRPSNRYLDEFIRLKCAPDLLAWGVYPNVKEITESAAAFDAVRTRMMDRLGDPSITVLCIGDGASPRTAAMFACRTKWMCWSIDPKLSVAPWEARIKRLKCMRFKIEDFQLCPGQPDEMQNQSVDGDIVVVAVHSHAALKEAERFHPILTVAIPCCVPQMAFGRLPDKEYADWGIHSPERTVKIWRKQ